MGDTTDDNKPDSYQFVGMGFSLGPASHTDGADCGEEGGADEAGEPTEAATEGVDLLAELGDRFATRLQLLWTYVKEIGAAAESTSFANMAGVLALVEEIAESAKGRDPNDAIASFEFFIRVRTNDSEKKEKDLRLTAPLFERRHARAIQDRRKYHDAALRILHETAVQQLVNAYEQLLGDLLRHHILANTSEASKDQSITYQQLLEFESLSEAKRHVVETQVTDFIRKNDTNQQFKYFRDQIKINISSSFPELRHYKELVLRRHSIVHASCTVTPDYIRKLRSIGGFQLPEEGSRLNLSPTYVRAGWDTVYSLGVVTYHLMAKALARREGNTEAEDSADNWLNTCAFWAIGQHRYTAAERILSYAHATRLAKDTCRLMVLINLAQTFKWQGRNSECKKLLSTHDWSAANGMFQLAAAVLRGEEVETLMTRAIREEQLSLDNIYEWPIFQELREREDFGVVLKKVFGTEASRPIEAFPPTLLDLSSKARLDKIFEHLNGKKNTLGASAQLSFTDAADPTVH